MKGGNAYIMLFKLGIYFIAIGIVKFIIYFIKKMGINASNYTNYEKNNVYRPFQGGDCTGGK